MAYELPPLPYPYGALEPHMDARTVEIHHTKHHQAYVNNLNKALEGHADLAAKPIEQLLREINSVPENIRQAVINNGGGHHNHTLFWQTMGPGKGGEPATGLADAVSSNFGSFDAFKEKFSAAAATQFASGWSWLGVRSDGSLCVCATPNHNNPLMEGHTDCPCTPILVLDVWEHAYYLKYQNRRPEYIAAWWNVVDWDKVAQLYTAARK